MKKLFLSVLFAISTLSIHAVDIRITNPQILEKINTNPEFKKLVTLFEQDPKFMEFSPSVQEQYLSYYASLSDNDLKFMDEEMAISRTAEESPYFEQHKRLIENNASLTESDKHNRLFQATTKTDAQLRRENLKLMRSDIDKRAAESPEYRKTQSLISNLNEHMSDEQKAANPNANLNAFHDATRLSEEELKLLNQEYENRLEALSLARTEDEKEGASDEEYSDDEDGR